MPESATEDEASSAKEERASFNRPYYQKAPFRDYGVEITTVFVGPERQEFKIYKKLLCESSDFFNAALTGGFEETQTGIISLPDDSPGGFSLYLNWVFSGSIPENNTEKHLHNLFDLYFWADKICLQKLKDQTMDSIQDMALKYDLKDVMISADLLNKVKRSTTEKIMGLRLFCVYMMVFVHSGRAQNGLTAEEHEHYGRISLVNPDPDAGWIHDSDLRFMQDICNGSFSMFRGYFDRLQHVLRTNANGDPRVRDEDDIQDTCFFHCHEEEGTCRENSASATSSKAAFVPGI